MKRNGLLLQIVWLLMVGLVSQARAAELYNFYDGVRGLGMGGVQVPVVNDETALLINPAALGKLRDAYLTFADPEIQMNNLTSKTLTENHGVGALTDPQELVDSLQGHQDSHYHSQAQLFPSMVFSNFGIGVFGIQTTDAENHSATGLIDLNYRRDIGVALGYNFRFWDGRIKLGVAGRLFDRAQAITSLPASSTSLTWDQLVNDGTALAVDGALILSAPIRFLPSMSFVMHDIGGTEFTLNQGAFYPQASPPSGVQQSLDVGLAMFPILARYIRMTTAIEMRDVLIKDDAERDHVERRLHAGVEINFADFFFVRGGYSQKFWTAGVELTSGFFQLQLASYGEDIGTPGSPREDRRYVLKTAFRF